MKRLMRDERGVTIVLVALLLVALVGAAALCVDVGRLYVERQHLVNACDAAALAGGLELPRQAPAEVKAGEAAVANHMPDYAVSFPTADRLRVDGQAPVEFAFAKVLGFDNRMVTAYAIVERIAGLSSTMGLRPWGLVANTVDDEYEFPDIEFGDIRTLMLRHCQNDPDALGAQPGDFLAVALGDPGANEYRDNILYGFQGTLEVGDWIQTEPGGMAGPTVSSVEELINATTDPASPWYGETYDNYTYGNPRVVLVPVITPFDSGREGVQILGFAAFFLTAFAKDTAQTYQVQGAFIEYCTSTGEGGGPDYGLSVLKLVE